jgi:hypothetical protein
MATNGWQRYVGWEPRQTDRREERTCKVFPYAESHKETKKRRMVPILSEVLILKSGVEHEKNIKRDFNEPHDTRTV